MTGAFFIGFFGGPLCYLGMLIICLFLYGWNVLVIHYWSVLLYLYLELFAC
jgi:hypothetical protein